MNVLLFAAAEVSIRGQLLSSFWVAFKYPLLVFCVLMVVRLCAAPMFRAFMNMFK